MTRSRPRITTLTLCLGLMAAPLAAQVCTSSVGVWPFGPSRTVVVEGDFAYLGRGSSLTVVNVRNPGSPFAVSDLELSNRVIDVSVEGGLAVVVTNDFSLHTVNVSDPAAPRVVATAAVIDNPKGVVLRGRHAYVSSSAWLQVFDVSVAAAPVAVGWVNIGEGLQGLDVSDTHAYVAQSSAGVMIVDITDPTRPRTGRRLATPGWVLNLEVEDARLYVADFEDTLRIYDLTDPADPGLLGVGDIDHRPSVDVAVAGDRAFVLMQGAENGIEVFDVSDPANPIHLTELESPGNGQRVVFAAAHLFVADDFNGLQAVDVTDPAQPTLADHVDATDDLRKPVISGRFAYVPSFWDGVTVFDLSSPAKPVPIGALDLENKPVSVVVAGSLAYLGGGGRGFDVVDVADPSAPTLISTIDLGGTVQALAPIGAYVAAAGRGLRMVDVSDPTAPVERATTPSFDDGRRIAIDGAIGYLTDDSGLLRVLDLTDPLAPVELGALPGLTYPHGLTVQGTIVWLLQRVVPDAIVTSVDVSDPTTPASVGSVRIDDVEATDLEVEGDVLFVTVSHHDGNRLVEIDVADAASPSIVGELRTARAGSLAASGGHLWLAGEGLESLDLGACPTLAPGPMLLTAPVHGSPAGGCGMLLEWDASPGAFDYDVYVDTVDPPAGLAATGVADTSLPITLRAAATYYWKVVARNSVGQSESPTWSFTTSSDGPTDEIVNSVRTAATSTGELTITWDDVSPAPDDYVVLQSVHPDGPFRNVVGSATTGSVGVTIPIVGRGPSYYRVAARFLPDCVGPF